ncbi:MAG: exosome complex RNA-binding protein Rrp4 [Nitrososphaerota archaeon]|nr:exosome complex RNA-binding protein Rrp4 [Candidatus Bathyarchaeota archaeon]MCX8162203.1 exosome complex RNA-binding protein Rrp4 [Candidatus Bathyarchaeota archaeon]MDW8062230.1 exosome complex RNA-binding protein Rrp4 [Nitrososphaerota archaeon]
MAAAEERKIVLPGDLIAEGEGYEVGVNVYRDDGRIYSYVVGLASIVDGKVSVTALKGVYVPKRGDVVIGVVREVSITRWLVDINSPYQGILPAIDVFGKRFSADKVNLQDYLKVGDAIIARVASFDRTTDAILTIGGKGLGKIGRGRLEYITPTKIPRLIGKRGSMINLLKKESGCNITIGKNGVILIEGPNGESEELVAELIRKVDREAHVPGLTDRVAEILRSAMKRE